MSYERYGDYRLAPDDNGCWDVLDNETYTNQGTFPSKAAAKRFIDSQTVAMTSTPNNKGDMLKRFEQMAARANSNPIYALSMPHELMSILETQRQTDYAALMAGLPEKKRAAGDLDSDYFQGESSGHNEAIDQFQQLLDKVYKGE